MDASLDALTQWQEIEAIADLMYEAEGEDSLDRELRDVLDETGTWGLLQGC